MRPTLNIASVSVAMLSRILEATASHPHADQTEIARFAGAGTSTTARAIMVLMSLGLIEREPSGRLICTSADVRRGMGDNASRQVLRKALISFRPFEAVCEGLALGENLQTATRKAVSLLGLRAADASKFDVLVRWAKELDILRDDGAKGAALVVTLDIGPGQEHGIISAADVESEAKARLYVANCLGRTVYNGIEEAERALLAGAVLSYQSDPARSVEKSGQAVENFLRHVCDQRGVGAEASKLNGSGQLANLLVGKGLIHSHQQKLVEVVGTLRNAKAHHKDKKTLTPWAITPEASFGSVLLALSVIRSAFEYLDNGKQIL